MVDYNGNYEVKVEQLPAIWRSKYRAENLVAMREKIFKYGANGAFK